MEKKYIIIIVAIVALLLIAVGIVVFPKLKANYLEKKDIETRKSWQEEKAETTDIEVNDSSFPLYTEKNEEINIDDYKDKPIMMIFWNSNNEDSIELIRRADKLYNNYKDEVNFLLISTDQEVNTAIDEEIEAPIYYDFYQEASRNLELDEVPAVITIDKDGNINNARGGLASSDMLEANLDILTDNLDNI